MIVRWLFCLVSFFMAFSPLNGEPALPVQAVAFDFGGVVAKADRTKIATFLMATCDIDQEELARAMVEMKSYRKQEGSEESFWQQYALAKGKILPADWSIQFNATVTAAIYEIPGTVAIIQQLKKAGYITALLSNVIEEKADVIRQLGYYKLFQPNLLSCEIGLEKPSPEAFSMLLQALDLPSNAVIFVDDKIQNVEAARAQGIDSILFISAEQLTEDLRERGITF